MEVMDVNEMFHWLEAHGHEDVVICNNTRVESTYKGKRRAYERVAAELSYDDPAMFDIADAERSAYWKKVAP